MVEEHSARVRRENGMETELDGSEDWEPLRKSGANGTSQCGCCPFLLGVGGLSAAK